MDFAINYRSKTQSGTSLGDGIFDIGFFVMIGDESTMKIPVVTISLKLVNIGNEDAVKLLMGKPRLILVSYIKIGDE
jgi:hypothetical protein